MRCIAEHKGYRLDSRLQDLHFNPARGVVTRSSSRRCGLPESASTSRGVTTRQSKQRRCKRSAPVDN
ncbi:hypothetical protein MRX96_030783 [Rhipicephalus microplus]